jgi:hypothetical protein
MCVVSFVGDHFQQKWTQPIYQTAFTNIPEITKAEFDALKKEVEEMKALLIKAKEYDEKNNEPNCEIEEKMKFLKEVAKLVGIDLDEVLKKKE